MHKYANGVWVTRVSALSHFQPLNRRVPRRTGRQVWSRASPNVTVLLAFEMTYNQALNDVHVRQARMKTSLGQEFVPELPKTEITRRKTNNFLCWDKL